MRWQDFYKRTKQVAVRLLQKNWGFPFIAGFLLLLLSAAVLLAAEFALAAETAANMAYFALAAGVILELLGLGRGRRKGEIVLNGSS